MKKTIISTQDAPAAVGTYSQAVMVGDFLFASGQLGLVPSTGAFAGESFAEQAEQVMKNVQGILASQGMDFGNVVKTSVFLTDMADFATLNQIYAKYFTEPYPARSAVAVKALPKGGLVEMEIIAAK